MPFRIDFMKSMKGESQPHYHLFNLNKKQYAKKYFLTKESAISFAKNAIRFREKKNSKVVNKGGKTFVLPI